MVSADDADVPVSCGAMGAITLGETPTGGATCLAQCR